jgi:hypothetical protein
MSDTSRGAWQRLWYGPDRANARVVPVACVLIVAQLAYRAWASYHSYWEGDDLLFIVQTFGPDGRSPHNLLTGIAGHVMPGGLMLTWLLNRASPYNFGLAAASLTVLQALASIGFLRMLLVGFGRRWGIIPPLVVYLATAFTVQSAVWWATGVQSLPVQIAFTWALGSQLTYLRTRRARFALEALAWVVAGLCFYEKSVLVLGALAIVTFAWFTHGSARDRIRQVWNNYRVSLVGAVALGAAYLALYITFGLSFDPGRATSYPIGPTADVMVLRTWSTAALGGPLEWRHTAGAPVSFAAPSSLIVFVAVVVLALVAREVARSRTFALRALLLPGYFLVSDVLLVVASRATLIGPMIGYELRYLSELSAVTAAGLAFATMPVRGAVEKLEVRRPSVLLDRRRPAALACVAVALLGTVSTFQSFQFWHDNQPGKAFFTRLVADARRVPPGTPVVDTTVPTTLLWPLSYPNNTLSHLLRPLPRPLDYATSGTDHVLYLAPDGHLRQLALTPGQEAVIPERPSRCTYRVGQGVRRIPLQGPALFGGWWVRIGYIATADSSITVSAGGRTQETSVSRGLHTLYFQAGDRPFHRIRLAGLIGGATLCTDDVTVGHAAVSGPS